MRLRPTEDNGERSTAGLAKTLVLGVISTVIVVYLVVRRYRWKEVDEKGEAGLEGEDGGEGGV